ncbi:hypothetical protein K1T71_009281 [Dendrolimus kikuchii]|uniref:Uncharacterized protein n=1 Tax=Dendrolimus kikuchii TaxID=765133 RepID=A0ACC1CU49_9NEOP|nr:hypothetical protein K1T71_009281 [Dendrolimus kikuchii]
MDGRKNKRNYQSSWFVFRCTQKELSVLRSGSWFLLGLGLNSFVDRIPNSAGLATIEAVRPVLQDWTKRRHGTLTFRLTQVLSGHGCFGRYLCRLGREPTSGCHHCDTGDEDTALHTLQVCPAWAEQRQDLVAITGLDLSLPAVVRTMVGSRTGWDAVSSFCERVMLAKEEAERERERTSLLRSRQRRTRRRRRASQDLRPP